MVKIIREPLTDIYGRDFMTGKVIAPRVVEQEVGLEGKVNKWLKNKKEEAKKIGRTDGKIYVDGFGWVSL